MYDKESVYDEEIAPLMQQIIEICKREELPMVAQFYLKEKRENNDKPMYCSTVILLAKEDMKSEVHEQLKYISEVMRHGPKGKPFVVTTITKE